MASVRPSSQRARRAIISAFLKLMETSPIDGITTDAIAQKAGASKSTLYKHWPNKAALVDEMLEHLLAVQPTFDADNRREDARHILCDMFVVAKRGQREPLWPRIFAYAGGHPEFRARLREAFCPLSPKHALISVLCGAVSAGELPANLDVKTAADLLMGALLRHFLVYGEVPQDLVNKTVEMVWHSGNCVPVRGRAGTKH